MTGSRGTKSRLWHLAALSGIQEALREAFISLTRVRPCRADHGVTDLKLLADDGMLLSIIRPISTASDVLYRKAKYCGRLLHFFKALQY